MQKSLADFDTDFLVSSDTIFNQKRKLLKNLFVVKDGRRDAQQEKHEQDNSGLLWREMLCNTPQGILEIENISAGQPGNMADGMKLYEKHEAERVMVPKTKEQQNETARRFFGGLLQMTESPIIQNHASFYQPDGSIRPSSLRFMKLFSHFLHRIPGHCPCSARGYSKPTAAMWHDMNLLLCGVHEAQSHLQEGAGCVKASQRWLKLATQLGDAAYLMGGDTPANPHPFLDVELVVESGTDDDFSRLQRLILHSGSWIRATCIQLNGLSQALTQISGANQLAKMRAFQHLLDRKCRGAFGALICSRGGSKINHEIQLILEHVKRELLSLLPPVSEVEEGRKWVHGFLELAILEATEDLLTGKEEARTEIDVIIWVHQLLTLAIHKFFRIYSRRPRGRPEYAMGPGPEGMIPRLKEAARSFLYWYLPVMLKPELAKLEARQEALAAFRGIIAA